jgi:hypothetical protein
VVSNVKFLVDSCDTPLPPVVLVSCTVTDPDGREMAVVLPRILVADEDERGREGRGEEGAF